MRKEFRKAFLATVCVSFCLTSCTRSQPQTVTLTLKRDGSQFSGRVVGREANSITVTTPQGDTHTFLNNELSDIKFGGNNNDADQASPGGTGTESTAANQQGGSASPRPLSAAPGGGTLQFPAGTVFPVRIQGFIDSCCPTENTNVIGVLDGDVKSPAGQVLLPEGATVVSVFRNEMKVDGRLTMIFELGSADFGGRHYLVTSAGGASAAGATVTLSGAKDRSQEAATLGLNVHVPDNSLLTFKAETPVLFKQSE